MKKKKTLRSWITEKMNPITHGKDLEDAISTFNRTKCLMENQVSEIQRNATKLYEERKKTVSCLQEFKATVLSIQNCPIAIINSCDRALESASLIADAWELEDTGKGGDTQGIIKSSKAASVIGVSGALAGSLTAALGPSSLMAIATTFGTASTGTAISALGGAAASHAALAWLGGGALAAGGAGIAGGSFILGLLGPIGIGIAGVTTLGSALLSRSKNNKNIESILSQVEEMRKANNQIRKANKSLKEVLDKTLSIRDSMDFRVLSKKSQDYFAENFPKEHLFELATQAKLLGKMTTEEISLAI